MTLKLPRVAETSSEVVIAEWVASVGDALKVGDIVIRVETDKAQIDVPSPIAGTLVEKLVDVDQEVGTGSAYAVVES